jgi:hypothetical protein
MNRVASLWNTVLFRRHEPLYAVRVLAILSFATILGTQAGYALHYEFLSGFFGGMSVASSGILVSQLFRMGSAEYKRDPYAGETIGLHLSR